MAQPASRIANLLDELIQTAQQVEETVENIRKNDACLPRSRPRIVTANYFTYLLNKLTSVGDICIVLVIIFPEM
jgi:preprotein translocase subunit SecY